MDERRRRWPGDEGGGGVGSGALVEPTLRQLLGEIRDDRWVTEDPIGHLGPKLRAWLEADPGGPWSEPALADRGGVLEVTIAWLGIGRMRDLRADAHALIGSFAEDRTFVAQSVGDRSVTFTVATGQPDTPTNRAHGHLVMVEVVGEGAARAAAGTRGTTG